MSSSSTDDEQSQHVPEAFRDALGALQHFVPRWAHLSNHTTQPASPAERKPGDVAQAPAASAAGTAAAAAAARPIGSPNYASTGDLRVLCAMGGSVGETGDHALREYFFTEIANPKSDYNKHADDLLFVVVPAGAGGAVAGTAGSKSSADASSVSPIAAAGASVFGAVKGLFKKVFSSDKPPVAVVHTPQQLLAQPASPSVADQQQQKQKSFSSAAVAGSSSPQQASSPLSSSPIAALATTGHPCADAADPVAAGEMSMKGSTVSVLRRGIAPLQTVVSAAVTEMQRVLEAVAIAEGRSAAEATSSLPRRRNSFVGERLIQHDEEDPGRSNGSSNTDDFKARSEHSLMLSQQQQQQQQQQLACLENGVSASLHLAREPNWFATIALNLVCQWPYYLNVAVVKMIRVKDLSASNAAVPVAIRTVQRQVFPTLNPPRNLRMTLRNGGGSGGKDAGEDGNDGKLEYPDMHFTVDDFEEAFGDIRLAPGHKLAVLLTAGGPPAKCGSSVAVFRGVVNYDSLVQQLMRQEKMTGKSLASHQQTSSSSSSSFSASSALVGTPAVVPLKAQSGRAEVAIWLTEADVMVAHQRASSSSPSLAVTAAKSQQQQQQQQQKDGTFLQGTEVLHCALTRVSLHCSHVVSALLQDVPWHHLHASWLPKQSAAPSKTKWMVFPRDTVQLSAWLEEDVATCKALGLPPQ